ncbi:hypothetical protein Acor_29690 [Acrocarpospora corrugata]|uniref:Uncharacterized protein n=1 Tax=Acrocarpospora corrugata TaxID=35763 RepID=A0A5M3VVS1_9ACTN|nr:hypothetical protein Acor_29690 [Acrocarpospora corrugata]
MFEPAGETSLRRADIEVSAWCGDALPCGHVASAGAEVVLYRADTCVVPDGVVRVVFGPTCEASLYRESA